jgi:hypothetical protein
MIRARGKHDAELSFFQRHARTVASGPWRVNPGGRPDNFPGKGV